MDWTITIDLDVDQDVTEDHVDDLLESLVDHDAALSVQGSRISAVLTILDHRSAVDAAALGHQVFTKALAGVGLVPVRDVALEAVTVEEADRRLDVPTIPPLVGAAEAAEVLGVSRQRVHQLHRGHKGFPRPAVQVKMGPLWTRASIEAFDQFWERRPGRPRNAPSAGWPPRSLPGESRYERSALGAGRAKGGGIA